MKIRTLILSAAALTVLAIAPAMAEDKAAAMPAPGTGPGHAPMLNADTDGDGFLSKAEFMAVQEKRFSEMDANSDGKVSKDEMKAHFESMRDKMKEMRQERMDKKPDGEKSKPE